MMKAHKASTIVNKTIVVAVGALPVDGKAMRSGCAAPLRAESWVADMEREGVVRRVAIL